MVFHVLTIFPEFVASVFEYGVLRRAVDAGLISHNIVDLRDFTDDRHRTTDDAPFGGGPGMVMLCDPVFRAVDALRTAEPSLPLYYLSPAGRTFNHETAVELAGNGSMILLCGRYEGIDQRIIDELVDDEISIGDFVLSGGEPAAICLIDAVARQIPGVLGNEESTAPESFASGLLDWPHYTRPEVYRGLSVPQVLLSGHHANVARWRSDQALLLTYERRPDLLTSEQRSRAEQLLKARRPED